MKFKPAADTISIKNIYSNRNMARTAAPAKKQAPKTKPEAPTTVEKIVPLTGKALKAKVKELSHLKKSETAKACGYYSVAKDGKIRVSLTKFYDAVLQSEGISVDEKPKVDGRGREASYRATVHGNGQILIGAAYTKALNLVPGDEFEIKMGYKHIHLKAIDKEAEA
jgi:AbrB-like transcriptional regulator